MTEHTHEFDIYLDVNGDPLHVACEACDTLWPVGDPEEEAGG